MSNNINKIYASNHLRFFDKIALKKRIEISDLINEELKQYLFKDALDIGTTDDEQNESSNIIIKSLKNIEELKSISDQNINSSMFKKTLKKSITSEFSQSEIEEFKSDIVISSATIEHVGSCHNQLKMIENMIKLSKKFFIIITPNRSYPVDFHTKIPLIHWLPKNIHRYILRLIGLKFHSKEENLNLIGEKDFRTLMKNLKYDYKIMNVKLLFLKSNLILIGKK